MEFRGTATVLQDDIEASLGEALSHAVLGLSYDTFMPMSLSALGHTRDTCHESRCHTEVDWSTLSFGSPQLYALIHALHFQPLDLHIC